MSALAGWPEYAASTGPSAGRMGAFSSSAPRRSSWTGWGWGPVTLESGQTSTTRLGDWYASAWAWRPQVALFVSEATLFPILMPLAPAATLLARFPDGLA